MLKQEGGLGFRDLHHFNRALLAKLAWKLLDQPEALVSRILKSKYFRHEPFANARLGFRPTRVSTLFVIWLIRAPPLIYRRTDLNGRGILIRLRLRMLMSWVITWLMTYLLLLASNRILQELNLFGDNSGIFPSRQRSRFSLGGSSMEHYQLGRI